EAIKRGAVPVSPGRAAEALRILKNAVEEGAVGNFTILTCSGVMGENVLKDVGIENFRVVCEVGERTTREDTQRAVRAFLERGVDLIAFCGGDGTLRDIVEVADKRVPLVGIPAGVKMHSGIFAVNPASAGKLLVKFLQREIGIGVGEVMDLDEEEMRKGRWVVRLYSEALYPVEPELVQSSKMMIDEIGEQEALQDIADYVAEIVEGNRDTLFLLGPGSTLKRIGEALGVDKTLLGVDAYFNGELVGVDLDERGIVNLLKKFRRSKIILSPIGAQGFILGRGNQQISPEVLKRVGVDNIIVVATPGKLRHTPFLRVDTGSREIDEEFLRRGYIRVITGYRRERMIPIKM
ncbi:MAG: ATP-NAD kinase family protein, partial [Thermoplasmata archaeon]|nr:ATP-NAD kinase family protein [Thermoplasmata archaeon]